MFVSPEGSSFFLCGRVSSPSNRRKALLQVTKKKEKHSLKGKTLTGKRENGFLGINRN